MKNPEEVRQLRLQVSLMLLLMMELLLQRMQ
jgi:hypothetical protein